MLVLKGGCMNLILTIIFMSIANISYADTWYIVNKDEIVVAKQNGPVRNDLPEGFFVVKSSDDIDLSKSVYRNNKIVERKKTQSDIDKEIKLSSDKQSAIVKLRSIGLTDDEIKAILQ